ncbi:hypothetical protein H072_11590 [Dactylellina haptotyla CBS 200.50]|uniref:Uncharacterized protein n=1 Tax=Dactylellina haptotyla (strain CBS 200.50) TaxID=1284197 RepID=S8A1M7_DACHA|nr:hypothetical protein H072_11590 [Dactylellina haptotyla CBS 200.50]
MTRSRHSKLILLLGVVSLTSVTALPQYGGSQDGGDAAGDMSLEESDAYEGIILAPGFPQGQFPQTNLDAQALGLGGAVDGSQGFSPGDFEDYYSETDQATQRIDSEYSDYDVEDYSQDPRGQTRMMEEVLEADEENVPTEIYDAATDAGDYEGDYEQVSEGYEIDPNEFIEEMDPNPPTWDMAPESIPYPQANEQLVNDFITETTVQDEVLPESAISPQIQVEEDVQIQEVQPNAQAQGRPDWVEPKQPKPRLLPSSSRKTYQVPARNRAPLGPGEGYIDPAPLDPTRYHGYYEPFDQPGDIDPDFDSDGSELPPEDLEERQRTEAWITSQNGYEPGAAPHNEYDAEGNMQILANKPMGIEEPPYDKVAGRREKLRDIAQKKWDKAERARELGEPNTFGMDRPRRAGPRTGTRTIPYNANERKRPVRSKLRNFDEYLRNIGANSNAPVDLGSFPSVYNYPEFTFDSFPKDYTAEAILSEFDRQFRSTPYAGPRYGRTNRSSNPASAIRNRVGNRLVAQPSANQGGPRGPVASRQSANQDELTPAEIENLFALQDQQAQAIQASTRPQNQGGQQSLNQGTQYSTPDNALLGLADEAFQGYPDFNFMGGYGAMPNTGGLLDAWDTGLNPGPQENNIGNAPYDGDLDALQFPALKKQSPTRQSRQPGRQARGGPNPYQMLPNDVMDWLMDHGLPVTRGDAFIPIEELRMNMVEALAQMGELYM